ncbi:MAG: type III polyketide synthase [Anaerolineae bacterium]|nr:type III polyketide synthase [Anaerolineae bacterium]
MARVIGLATAVPPYQMSQSAVKKMATDYFRDFMPHVDRMASVFDHADIDTRYFVVSEEWWHSAIPTLKARNEVYLREAVALLGRAIQGALDKANLTPQQIDNLIVVSSSGIATPSLDARVMNTLKMRSNVRRTPIWGLGCAGGVAGLARAAEMARAYPHSITVLATVETSSLTFLTEDHSKKNFIATALFADGAAAVVLAGDEMPATGPEIIDSMSTLWPDTLAMMGWNVVNTGLEVLFGVEIPRYAADLFRPEVDCFLGKHGLSVTDISHHIFHPGGSKVLDALERALELPNGDLAASRQVLRCYGNMSSSTVLFVLDYILKNNDPQSGALGLMTALGPGFSAEQLLIRF